MRGLLARPNTVLAAVLVAIAVVYLAAARVHRLGTVANPGPGLFPVLLGVALLVCAVLLVLGELLAVRRSPGRPEAAGGLSDREAWRRLLPFSAAAVAYPVLAGSVGFEAATALGLAGLALVMGERRPVVLVVLGLAGAAVTFAVFRRLLGVPLP